MARKKYTYAWIDSLIACWRSRFDTQTVSKFAEAATLSKWHDEDLQQCTRELNATLDKYRDIRRSELQMLSLY